MKTAKATLVVAMLGCLLLGVTAASGSSNTTTQAAGTIHMFGTQHGLSRNSTIVITGAIGDYGETFSIDKNGNKDPNGDYLKVMLQHGTFKANTVALSKKLAKLEPTVYKNTCSGQFVATSPVTLFDGTRRYAGITGTVHMTVTGAYILPRYKSGKKKGQCNENTEPIGVYTTNTGSGNVTFSQKATGRSARTTQQSPRALPQKPLVVLFGGAGLAASRASAASASAGKHFTVYGFQQGTFIPVPGTNPKKLSQGDEIIVNDQLTSTRRGKHGFPIIGHDAGTCTFTRITNSRAGLAQCVVTAVLPRGTIAVQGVDKIKAGVPQPSDLAVTGGTGRYNSTTGTVHVKDVPGHVVYTFRLS